MIRTTRSGLAPALLLATAFLGLSLLVGCSEQGEGDRCSILNGNADCSGSLECTPSSRLRSGADKVDRCCPASLDDASDSRCSALTSTDDGNGTGSGSGGAAQGGAGGATSGGETPGLGDSCAYNSDCLAPLVCGPGGVCQHECLQDRDCPSGSVCSADLRCEVGTSASGGSAGAGN